MHQFMSLAFGIFTGTSTRLFFVSDFIPGQEQIIHFAEPNIGHAENASAALPSLFLAIVDNCHTRQRKIQLCYFYNWLTSPDRHP